jgi:hypothetical protein
MTKTVDDAVLDAALNQIRTTADKLVVCIGAPANYAEANANSPAGKRCGQRAVTPASFTGPANGDVSGRKLTVNQQTGIPVDASGAADHVALVDDGASILLAVTSLSAAQTVTAGNTMTVNAFDLEIADPS